MNAILRTSKQTIREFLKQRTDAELCLLLDKARAGAIDYMHCATCLLGTLFGVNEARMAILDRFNHPSEFTTVDAAYCALCLPWPSLNIENVDVARQKRLIPMVLSELKRRRLPVLEKHEPSNISEPVSVLAVR